MKILSFFLALYGAIELSPVGALSTDLLDIAESATPSQIQDALKNGADPNAVDYLGRSVLMLAAASNPAAVTPFLDAPIPTK